MSGRPGEPRRGRLKEWETPPELFASLHAEFGFELDPCASEGNHKCPNWYGKDGPPGSDGLSMSWAPSRCFMNPPYGRGIWRWVAKARQEALDGALVVGLLPASTDTNWWWDYVHDAAAEARFIKGRVQFWLDGEPVKTGAATYPSVVVVWMPSLVRPAGAYRGIWVPGVSTWNAKEVLG